MNYYTQFYQNPTTTTTKTIDFVHFTSRKNNLVKKKKELTMSAFEKCR